MTPISGAIFFHTCSFYQKLDLAMIKILENLYACIEFQFGL